MSIASFETLDNLRFSFEYHIFRDRGNNRKCYIDFYLLQFLLYFFLKILFMQGYIRKTFYLEQEKGAIGRV